MKKKIVLTMAVCLLAGTIGIAEARVPAQKPNPLDGLTTQSITAKPGVLNKNNYGKPGCVIPPAPGYNKNTGGTKIEKNTVGDKTGYYPQRDRTNYNKNKLDNTVKKDGNKGGLYNYRGEAEKNAKALNNNKSNKLNQAIDNAKDQSKIGNIKNKKNTGRIESAENSTKSKVVNSLVNKNKNSNLEKAKDSIKSKTANNLKNKNNNAIENAKNSTKSKVVNSVKDKRKY